MRKIRDCPFSEDVLYDTEHNVWVRMDGDVATVGIDTILAWLSGPFTAVSFKPVGSVVERGKSIGSTEGPRHFDVVRSPLTGHLLEVNSALRSDPKAMNRDPYGTGWFARLRPSDLASEKGRLLTLAAATEILRRRADELRVRCFADFPDYDMFEIGTECSAVLVRLDELLSTAAAGTVVHVVSDDPTAEVEMIRWSELGGNELVESRREGNLSHFIVKKRL